MAGSLGVLPPAVSVAAVPLIPTLASSVACTSPSSAAPLTAGALTQTATTSMLASSSGLHSQLPGPGVSLSPATTPFPQKIVDKARSGQYVELKDLLTDNISLIQQLDVFGTQHSAPSLPGALKPRLREVTNLTSWMYTFLAYVALRANEPGIRDMLAYARLFIREAQRHGGSGFLDYDRVFRQQVAIDPSLKWNILDPGIQAATLVGRTSTPVSFCLLCREPDHKADNCALAYLQPPGLQSPALAQPVVGARTAVRRRLESVANICVTWNRGRCRFNPCKFRHVCATCQQPHMAKDCVATSSDSEYKKPTIRGAFTPYSQAKPLF